MERRNRAVLTLLVAIAGAAACGGCMYTADVRNETPSPVLVRMMQQQALKRDWVMDSVRVPPGERVRLGPARATAGKVVIEAGERTRTEEPAVLRIQRRRAALEIVLATDGHNLVLRHETDPEAQAPGPPASGSGSAALKP